MSDKKLAVASTTDPNLIAYYNADVVTASDYYPFGSQMPGRKFSQANSIYRYGFNGHEKSTEINGSDNLTTAEFGELDTRLGRRWNLDPKPDISFSAYSVFGNNPIFFNDIKLDSPANPLKLLKPGLQCGYPGEAVVDLFDRGIKWLGKKASGSNVSTATSQNIQLATSLLSVVVSKGKNPKSDEEAIVQLTKKLSVKDLASLKGKFGVYVVKFKDGTVYVGKTIREFKTRILEGLRSSQSAMGKAGKKIDDIEEVIVHSYDVSKDKLKFLEQSFMDGFDNLLNRIRAVRK